MGINKVWLREEPFARSIERQIDRATLVDLLGIVIYEADRSAKLEDAGFADQASSVDCLFDYVLDALGVPPGGRWLQQGAIQRAFLQQLLARASYRDIGGGTDWLRGVARHHRCQINECQGASRQFPCGYAKGRLIHNPVQFPNAQLN